MNFVGIDLAWTYKNESGICVIDDAGQIIYCEAKNFSDLEIASIAHNFSTTGVIVGIDAPLIVNNQEGSRYCDRALMKGRFHEKRLSVFACSKKYMLNRFGVIRGEKVVKQIKSLIPNAKITTAIQDHDYVLMETFPTGIFLSIFPQYYPIKYKLKNKVPFEISKLEMEKMLKVLINLTDYSPAIKNIEAIFSNDKNIASMTKKEYKHLEDKVDAFLCAYSSYWLRLKKGIVFGDEQDGFIMLPYEQ